MTVSSFARQKYQNKRSEKGVKEIMGYIQHNGKCILTILRENVEKLV